MRRYLNKMSSTAAFSPYPSLSPFHYFFWGKDRKLPSWNHVSGDHILIGHFNIWAQQTTHVERTLQVFCLTRGKTSKLFDFHLSTSSGRKLIKNWAHTEGYQLRKQPRMTDCQIGLVYNMLKWNAIQVQAIFHLPCFLEIGQEDFFLNTRVVWEKKGKFHSHVIYAAGCRNHTLDAENFVIHSQKQERRQWLSHRPNQQRHI